MSSKVQEPKEWPDEPGYWWVHDTVTGSWHVVEFEREALNNPYCGMRVAKTEKAIHHGRLSQARQDSSGKYQFFKAERPHTNALERQLREALDGWYRSADGWAQTADKLIAAINFGSIISLIAVIEAVLLILYATGVIGCGK